MTELSNNMFPYADVIRTIPDYPKQGIMFRDVTTLMRHGQAFRLSVDEIAMFWKAQNISYIAGIEARGFIFGGAVASSLGIGFIPVRKKGKLPHETIGEDYQLEYGTDRLEVHKDAAMSGDRVVIIDDLIATGGTAMAATNLLRSLGAVVVGASFVVDLPDLGGAAKLSGAGLRVHALTAFGGH